MLVLLVITFLVAAAGVALLAEMFRRDEPTLGASGLAALMFAAVLAVVYGTLDTA